MAAMWAFFNDADARDKAAKAAVEEKINVAMVGAGKDPGGKPEQEMFFIVYHGRGAADQVFFLRKGAYSSSNI